MATTLGVATSFLYTGPNPIQTGVAPGTIDPVHVSVLRGKVFDSANAPLPGVTVSVLNHPEFGQTVSRADGVFDMAVNGGGSLTVDYQKAGFMPVQRKVDPSWQDYDWADDVIMLPYDTNVTTIDFTAPVQTARGSVVTDADGTRQATLLFEFGTTAEMVMPDGTTQPLTTMNVRASEYTVGPNGPDAMPAALPPSSAYTYAVELSVDEAVAAGATSVTFSKPVPFYVDNFLNFPTGEIVPVGFYDREKGHWVPSENGLVIEILGVTGDMADIDIDGSGIAADAVALADIGITTSERQELALLYPTVGTSLWRAPIMHLTPYDCNWPGGPPSNAVASNQRPPDGTPNPSCPDKKKGSIIECQNQTLGEVVDVVGTPFTLHYKSDRVAGSKAGKYSEYPAQGRYGSGYSCEHKVGGLRSGAGI